MIQQLTSSGIALLKALIKTPSFSRDEAETATLIASYLEQHQVTFRRQDNNVWAYNRYFDSSKPTILLNSHHDTVRANSGYTRDPFDPVIEDGKLFGLGSNDAGGCLVSLISVFLYYYNAENLAYNICLAATAEEEISGQLGIASILTDLGPLDFAIVGEPTLMQMAIAEKGLMVLDCTAHGVAGHAARDEGQNAIYLAMKDISWFSSYQFPKVSELTGPIKMSVTQIQAGSQHNVVPATCTFVVDVRVTEQYTNEELLALIREEVTCDVVPRSIRLKSSSISIEHPIVKSGLALGISTYGSPTLSDQALLNIPSLKMGPGDSARSHSADEFVFLNEIEDGIIGYIQLLDKIL